MALITDEESPRGIDVVATGDGYEGYVVIDTVVDNKSAGGVRIASDLPLDEVRELAREMSLKFALFHLPRGGAKAGLRMADHLQGDARLAALAEFGRRLAPLIRNGIYSPGMDMNCGPDQLRAIYRGAGIQLGKITDTSWFTAISVFHALEATVQALGITGRPVTVAIEGFGSVARYLADRLDPERYRIAAVATIQGAVRADPPYLPSVVAEAKDAHGDGLVGHLQGESLAREAVLTVDADVVLPSSRTWVITADLAHAMQARAVVPIANAPFTEGTIDILHAKNVLCLPGYVSNVAGVLASSLYDQGVPTPEVEALFAAEYRPVVEGILRVAMASGRPGTEVAAQLAQMHMETRRTPRARGLAQRVFDRFVRGRLPVSVRAGRARQDYVRRLRSVRAEIAALEAR